MFKELTANYFQNHKKTRVKFPGAGSVTVFLGSSDQGKSSLLRLVNWIKDNRPSGVGFKNRKFKEKNTKGKIVLPEGVIKRVRGKKANYYKVNGVKLKAMGKKVPEEVTQLLNMNEINIQNQFDHFFLLQDSPGKVAQKFNEFVGLSIIDTVAKKAERTVRKYNKKMTDSKGDIDNLQKDLKKYKPLKIAKPLLDKANNIDSNIIGIELDIDAVNALKTDLMSYQDTLNSIPDLKLINSKLKETEAIQKDINKISTKINTISGIQDDLKELSKEKKSIGDLNEVKELLVEATQMQKDIRSSSFNIVKVKEYADSYYASNLLREQHTHDLTRTKKKIDKIHSKLKICPTCGKKWETK